MADGEGGGGCVASRYFGVVKQIMEGFVTLLLFLLNHPRRLGRADLGDLQSYHIMWILAAHSIRRADGNFGDTLLRHKYLETSALFKDQY